MTTFEGLILLAAIVVMIIITNGVALIVRKLNVIIDRQYANWEQLREISTHIYVATSTMIELRDAVNMMHRNLCVEIADKMVNRIYPDKESMNKIDWDKLSKEQQDEFLKRLIMPNYDSPFQPPFNPTCDITDKED